MVNGSAIIPRVPGAETTIVPIASFVDGLTPTFRAIAYPSGSLVPAIRVGPEMEISGVVRPLG